MNGLPAGFVLDQPTVLPAGFVLDQPKDEFVGPPVPDVGQARAALAGATQGVTAGFADELKGAQAASGMPWLPGSTFLGAGRLLAEHLMGRDDASKIYEATRDKERALYQRSQEQYPGTTLAGEVGGAVMIPVGGALNAATLPARMARGAMAGATYGGLSGVGSGTTAEDRTSRGLTGMAIGGVGGAVAAPLVEGALGLGRRMATNAALSKATPSTDDLVKSYVTTKNSQLVEDVQIAPQALSKQADVILAQLQGKKFSDKRAPQTFDLLDELRGASVPAGAKPTTMANIDDFRYQLRLLAGGSGPDAAAAQIAKKSLDEWVPKITPADIIAGDPVAAHAAFQAGRQDYAKAKLAEALDRRLAQAELRSGGAHSGLNLANTLRQRVTNFLDSDDSMGLSSAERELAEKFVKGGVPENVLRFTGKWMGGGGGLGSMATTAGAVTAMGPAGFAVPAAGTGLTMLSNSLARSEAQKLSELIRSNTPLALRMRDQIEALAKAAGRPTSPGATAALALQSQSLATSLRNAGIVVRPEDIMRAIQGPMRGAAEEEQ